jgi:Flp pilus assembly protein protease CpaA
MEWFSRKTSIAGIQIPNWVVVLGAIIVILLIYIFMQEVQTPD